MNTPLKKDINKGAFKYNVGMVSIIFTPHHPPLNQLNTWIEGDLLGEHLGHISYSQSYSFLKLYRFFETSDLSVMELSIQEDINDCLYNFI